MKKTVLVIEDSSDVRSLISDMLEMSGFECMLAENGLIGVEMARRHRPDLILCDVRMPELDGYGTLEALRKDEATASLPFIFLTGLCDTQQMRQGMVLGADEYLTKPFTVAELICAVNARLEKEERIVRQPEGAAEEKVEALPENSSTALPPERPL
jgi:DNA-binding response OmpR family regulator